MEVAVEAADKEWKKEQENVTTRNPLAVEKIARVHIKMGEIAKSKTALVAFLLEFETIYKVRPLKYENFWPRCCFLTRKI